MEKTASIISFIFHPILMPLLGILILFNSGTYLEYLPYDYKKWVFLIVALSTIVIPLGFLPFFYYQRIIDSTFLKGKRERLIPLVVTLALYIFCFSMLKRIPVPQAIHAFCLGAPATVFFALVLTIRWKISLHMTGLGGLIGLIAFLIWWQRINLEVFLIVAVLVAGITGTSRLYLNSHTPSEIFSGFVVGLITIPTVMYLY